jgi:hypothetical protein
MGNRISAVNGVRSPNFFQPGNAVNEIWLGDVEIISRLPFGDSEMAQAGWPKGDYPKLPWRPFIIPLRAAVAKTTETISSASTSITRRSAVLSSSLSDIFATPKLAAVSPGYILLMIVVLLLLGAPILMYSRFGTISAKCPSCRRGYYVGFEAADAGDEQCDCEHAYSRMERRAALAQLFSDLGILLLCSSAIAKDAGKLRFSGCGDEFHDSIMLWTQIVALISRAYLVRIWYICRRISQRDRSLDRERSADPLDASEKGLHFEDRELLLRER